MQNLWRKTSELFWQYPILWLPVLLANTPEWLLLWSQKVLARRIFTFFVQGHGSVLGRRPDLSTDPATVMKASLAAGLLSAGIYLLFTCLFITALLVISKLVRNCLDNRPPELKAAVIDTLQSCKRKTVVLSIKILALFAVGTLLLIFTMPHLARLTTMSYRDIGYSFSCILSVVIAYLLTPSIVAAISPGRPVTSEMLAKARLIAMIGVAASDLIGLFVQRAESSVFSESPYTSVLAQQLIGLTGSLFTAFPYIPISIALSVIAFSSQNYEETTEPIH
jgi:hypothetical protein